MNSLIKHSPWVQFRVQLINPITELVDVEVFLSCSIWLINVLFFLLLFLWLKFLFNWFCFFILFLYQWKILYGRIIPINWTWLKYIMVEIARSFFHYCAWHVFDKMPKPIRWSYFALAEQLLSVWLHCCSAALLGRFDAFQFCLCEQTFVDEYWY